MAMSYDPSTYPQDVPNPLGPRVHAWNGGPWDQGTRFRGAVWTRPQGPPSAGNENPWVAGGPWLPATPFMVNPLWAATDMAYPGEMSGLGSAADVIRPVMEVAGTVGAFAGAYHGYKRNGGSVGWAIGWFVFGGLLPILALPIMLAEGFGKRK
jgi:hypothetical protein